MVKVIPWETVCRNCNTKLSYNNEDVEVETRVYNLVTHTYRHITCPVCGKKVNLNAE